MRYFSQSVLVLLVLSLAAMPRSVQALEPREPGHGLCRDIVATVNEVADFTETLCLPAHDPEGMSLVLISSQPVGAVASVLAEAKAETHLLILTDADASRNGQFFSIAPPVAQQLLQQAREGALDSAQYYHQILAAMRHYPY
jgi:hypothetical protein